MSTSMINQLRYVKGSLVLQKYQNLIVCRQYDNIRKSFLGSSCHIEWIGIRMKEGSSIANGLHNYVH